VQSQATDSQAALHPCLLPGTFSVKPPVVVPILGTLPIASGLSLLSSSTSWSVASSVLKFGDGMLEPCEAIAWAADDDGVAVAMRM
jgi:hypothetical protein